MIKMKYGIYGLREGDTVKPMTPDSGPFVVPESEEQRLVDMGVAEKVYQTAAAPKAQIVMTGPPTYNVDMKFDDLKKIALEGYGVDASKAKSKAEVVRMIDDSLRPPVQVQMPESDEDEAEGQEDAPPSLEAEVPTDV